jgi:hypothetical protein
MNYDEAKEILNEAMRTESALNNFANRFAEFCVGRLRLVSLGTLIRLKRELRDFNIHTREWK